jgi:hypothetical protein
VGLVAKKSTWRKDSPDNMGEFQIIDPKQNLVVDGSRYDCTCRRKIEMSPYAQSRDDTLGQRTQLSETASQPNAGCG